MPPAASHHRGFRIAVAAFAAFALIGACGLALDLALHRTEEAPISYALLYGPHEDPGHQLLYGSRDPPGTFTDRDFVLWAHVPVKEARVWGTWSAPFGADRVLVMRAADVPHLLATGSAERALRDEAVGRLMDVPLDLAAAPGVLEARIGAEPATAAPCTWCTRPGTADQAVLVWTRGDSWVGEDPRNATMGRWVIVNGHGNGDGAPITLTARTTDAGLVARLPAWMGASAVGVVGTLASLAWWAARGGLRTPMPAHSIDKPDPWQALGAVIGIAALFLAVATVPAAHGALEASFPAAERALPLAAVLAGLLAGTIGAYAAWSEAYAGAARRR